MMSTMAVILGSGVGFCRAFYRIAGRAAIGLKISSLRPTPAHPDRRLASIAACPSWAFALHLKLVGISGCVPESQHIHYLCLLVDRVDDPILGPGANLEEVRAVRRSSDEKK